jgi:hypothetical protein
MTSFWCLQVPAPSNHRKSTFLDELAKRIVNFANWDQGLKNAQSGHVDASTQVTGNPTNQELGKLFAGMV